MYQRLIPGLAALAFATAPTMAQTSQPEASGYFRVQEELANWRAAHGDSWQVRFDEEAGFARFLFGGSAASAYQPKSDADWFSVARAAIAQSKAIHGVDTAELVEDQVALLPLSHAGSTDKVTVQFRQVKNGVPVLDGYANVLFDLSGKVLSVDTTAARGIAQLSTVPLVSSARAATIATGWFADDTGLEPTFVSAPELVIDQPLVGKFRVPTLAWQVNVQYVVDGFRPEGFFYRIDAATGSQSSRATSVHFDVSGNVKSFATPGHGPDVPSNPPTSQNMPAIRVTSGSGNAVADANGDFNIVGATAPLAVQVRYQGPYCTVNNSAGAAYVLNTTLNSSSGNNLVMNSPASGNVTAQANAFLWTNNMRNWTRAVNPSDATGDFLAVANVNISSTCNAYYDGVSINCFLPGGGCPNTAYSSVVLHELGHWYNDRYSSGNGSDGFGEGNADVFAMYQLDDPIVAQDFFGPGSNIRTGLNNTQFCGDCCGGCHGEVHFDGEVLMGALWKVRARLEAGLGQSAGAQRADTLFNGWMNAYNDTQIKTLIEVHWLTLDDDDGNITNGTPNYSYIDGGFKDQGFPGYGLTFVALTNVTQIPSGLATGPFTVNADATATFNPPVTSVSIKWRLKNAPAFQTVPMSFFGGTTWTGQIPVQACPSQLEYYVVGLDNGGQAGTYPTNAPTSVLSFVVGQEIFTVNADFESGTAGWTHGQVSGGDDWALSSQVGLNISTGEAGDPTSAPVSGTSIWGTDLGNGTNNGYYNDNQNEYLRSPVIDCTGVAGARLKFQRWLGVETSTYDHATVKVNNVLVWQNPNNTMIDASWTLMDIDISSIADNNPSVTIEFRLTTDSSVTYGGWNIDDVQIVSLTCGGGGCNTPQSYCAGKLNSNGVVPGINFSGTPQLSTQNFTVDLQNGTYNKTAVVFWGNATANLPFYGGTLCVAPPVVRGPQITTDSFGFASYPVNITPGMVGSTLYYQWWMRDPADPQTVGLSDALEVQFCN